jgi:hypothetical protein
VLPDFPYHTPELSAGKVIIGLRTACLIFRMVALHHPCREDVAMKCLSGFFHRGLKKQNAFESKWISSTLSGKHDGKAEALQRIK